MKHFIAITLLLLAAGCSGGIKISGTVTYEEDGSPVKSGTVTFSGTQGNFTGVITNGKYATGNVRSVGGIPEGSYKVFFSGIADAEYTKVDKGGVMDWETKVTYLITPEYTSAATTPISFDVVKGGAKTFDIKVRKPPDAAAAK
ncbi:MAG: hypothetical protein LBT89_01695 [Planctomycetaceae bacterium]|jgi:hypothetical protein|nr:hypothetical protein [Planctomycetaceae bacterium]